MKTCSVIGCNNPSFGKDKSTGEPFCRFHQYLRTDLSKPKNYSKPIPKKRFNAKFDYDTSYGYDSETIMYKKVWSTQKGLSFVSGLEINAYDKETCKCFAHVLEKAINKFPHFRFNLENIVLLTWDEHHLWDQGSEDSRKRYAEKMAKEGIIVDWNKLKLLQGKLIIIYKEKYK